MRTRCYKIYINKIHKLHTKENKKYKNPCKKSDPAALANKIKHNFTHKPNQF